mgnify:CR=1 FL=1
MRKWIVWLLVFTGMAANGQVKVNSGQRYLQDAGGKPFFWLGDTAWELPQRLTREEVAGVVAHELAHIAHRDVLVMTVASFFASLAAMIVQNGIWFSGGDDRDDDGPGLLAVIAVAALVYAISFLLLRALSRYREYAADRGAAQVTGRPSALAAALVRISDGIQRTPDRDLREVGAVQAFYIVPPRVKNAASQLFSTHPPTEKRIAALQRIETQLQAGRTV